MTLSKLPVQAQRIIDDELSRLTHNPDYDLNPQRRLDIYRALGPLSIPNKEAWFAHIKAKTPPQLTFADRVRARIAKLSAEKVIPLWQTACMETNANFDAGEDPEAAQREQEYLAKRSHTSLEHISVYDVPRAFIPAHIMEMADRAFDNQIQDYVAFSREANEWWQIYPRPERMERECFIKWACQEYLYEALGWAKHYEELFVYETGDDGSIAYNHLDAPAGYAFLAYAAIFSSPVGRFNEHKRHEFWQWWLAEAIPLAWQLEQNVSSL